MNTKFLLDENMPFALLEFLKNNGYDADHLKKLEKVGIKNGEVYKVAEQHGSWILTRDSDFKSYHKFITHNVRGIINRTEQPSLPDGKAGKRTPTLQTLSHSTVFVHIRLGLFQKNKRHPWAPNGG